MVRPTAVTQQRPFPDSTPCHHGGGGVLTFDMSHIKVYHVTRLPILKKLPFREAQVEPGKSTNPVTALHFSLASLSLV